MFGYVVYASEGVNVFVIHTYTNANLFPKIFKSLKDVFNGFLSIETIKMNAAMNALCFFQMTQTRRKQIVLIIQKQKNVNDLLSK